MGIVKNDRIEWVDSARGIAIIAVVVFHATIFLAVADSAWKWPGIIYSLETLRMPLFFFAAGLFAAKILTQTFAQLWAKRLSLFLYLYALWSVIRWAFFQFVPFVLPGSDASDWRELAGAFVWPAGGLWFIYALVIYSAFVWITRGLPAWAPIGASIAVSVVFSSGLVSIPNDAWMKVGSYAAFFVVAVHVKSWALTLASRITPAIALALLGIYAALAVAYQVLDLRDIAGLRLVVSIAGVAAGVGLATQLARVRGLSWLSWLGRNTLPIYLVHYLPIAGAAAVLVAADISVPGAVGAVAVPALAALAILLSLLVEKLLSRARGVFDLPGPLPRRVSADVGAGATVERRSRVG